MAIVTDEWQGLDLSRNVIILRAPNNEVPVIIASYLYFWLMTPAWQHHLELHTRGFMNNLSRKDLMHFDVPITDVGTQVAVSRALEQAMQHNAQLDRTLNALRQLTGTHRELVMEHAARTSCEEFNDHPVPHISVLGQIRMPGNYRDDPALIKAYLTGFMNAWNHATHSQ